MRSLGIQDVIAIISALAGTHQNFTLLPVQEKTSIHYSLRYTFNSDHITYDSIPFSSSDMAKELGIGKKVAHYIVGVTASESQTKWIGRGWKCA